MVSAVYRAPMRSRRPDVPEGAAVERGLTLGLCGMGGVLPRPPVSLDEALSALAEAYGERTAQRVERFASAPDGAFVWTLDVDGEPWLGRLGGPWRYDPSAEAARVDLVHVRPCDWVPSPIPRSQVPPAVQYTFRRGGLNWQQTHDPAVAGQSQDLWHTYGR